MSAPPFRILRVIARMNVGGPARQVIELAKGLRPRGFETTIATGSPSEGEGDLRGAAEAAGLRVVSVEGLGAAVRVGADLRAFAALAALIRAERPDVVHTHTAKAGALGRVGALLAKTRARVHTFHGTVFDGYFSPSTSRWIARAERALARLAHRVVAVSHATADELEAAGIAASKIRVIEPVVDLEPFLAIDGRHGALRRELGVADGERLVGLVGRLVPIKDPATFLEAAALVAAELPNARFALIGEGPLEAELRAQAERLGLGARVAFTGFRTDMPPVMADLDVVVSSSRKEGMPVAILEAMAAARPVVATRVGGTPELVAEERSGYLVEPGDAKALAHGIASVLKLPRVVREPMGGVARIRAAERFGRERGLEHHAQMYRELLGAGE